jgi:hypothetical protein
MPPIIIEKAHILENHIVLTADDKMEIFINRAYPVINYPYKFTHVLYSCKVEYVIPYGQAIQKQGNFTYCHLSIRPNKHTMKLLVLITNDIIIKHNKIWIDNSPFSITEDLLNAIYIRANKETYNIALSFPCNYTEDDYYIKDFRHSCRRLEVKEPLVQIISINNSKY